LGSFFVVNAEVVQKLVSQLGLSSLNFFSSKNFISKQEWGTESGSGSKEGRETGKAELKKSLGKEGCSGISMTLTLPHGAPRDGFIKWNTQWKP
jgi:hypothetical protein